jgi:peptide/nickel transport system substrate-binding protein
MNRALAILALLCVMGAACAPAQPSPQGGASTGGAAPAATPAPADFRLRVGLLTLQSTMDPHAAIGQNPRRYGLYECLVMQDATGKLIPGLATEWRNVSPTTWQFKLAPNRKFHDGAPVTIEDVKYSIDRAINPELKLGILTRVGTIERAEIVDPQTINVVTKAPDAILLYRMAVLVIVQKAHVERIGGAEFATRAMGTGPFMQKEFRPGDRLVLVPNPYHPTKPAATELVIRQVPELSARVAGLRTGELDLISNVAVDQADTLKSAGMNIVNFNQGTSIGAFIFTNQFDQPTANKLVRQAMNYAVDKEAIAKNIYKGYTQPTGQVVQSNTFGYNPTIKPYPYDPARARQLLAQAGYPNGFKIKMDVTLGIAEAQQVFLLVQNQFKDVGIDAEMTTSADSAFLLDRWYARVQRPQVFSYSLQNSPAQDADFALNWFRGDLPDPERRYTNPAFDEPYLASLTELDPNRRLGLLQRAIAAMYEDPPVLFLVDGFNLWGASPKIDNVLPRGDLEPLWEIIKPK